MWKTQSVFQAPVDNGATARPMPCSETRTPPRGCPVAHGRGTLHAALGHGLQPGDATPLRSASRVGRRPLLAFRCQALLFHLEGAHLVQHWPGPRRRARREGRCPPRRDGQCCHDAWLRLFRGHQAGPSTFVERTRRGRFNWISQSGKQTTQIYDALALVLERPPTTASPTAAPPSSA